MSYVLFGLLGIGAFFKKNSKVIVMFMLCFAIIIFGFSTKNADLANYRSNYMYGGSISEPLYLLFVSIFRSLNFDYTAFRVFLCTIGFILLTKTFYDLSPYPAVVFLFYLIYPFCMDVVQVRFFVAETLTLYSIRYIIKYRYTHENKNIFMFFLSIILAMGFHYSAALFLILSVLFLDTKKNSYFIYLIVPFVGVLCISQISSFGTIIGKITGTFRESHWVYLNNRASALRLLRLILSRGGFLLMLWLFGRTPLSLKKMEESDNATDSNGEVIMKSNEADKYLFLCVLYISMYTVLDILVASEFERINRIGMVIGCILLSRQISKRRYKDRTIMWCISFAAYILYFMSIMWGMSNANGRYFNAVFREVMENNPLF